MNHSQTITTIIQEVRSFKNYMIITELCKPFPVFFLLYIYITNIISNYKSTFLYLLFNFYAS